MYVNSVANTGELNPDYFYKSALNSVGMDRREFLEREIISLQQAIYNYQIILAEIMQEAAKLDGKNDVASWLTAIGAGLGSVATGTPAGVIGWVVAGAGTVWNYFTKRKDTKKAIELAERAQKLQLEAQIISDYYQRYTVELQLIKLRPVVVGGVLGLALKKRKK